MKQPIRTIEDKYGDKFTADFTRLTLTQYVVGRTEVTTFPTRAALWTAWRETKQTVQDKDY